MSARLGVDICTIKEFQKFVHRFAQLDREKLPGQNALDTRFLVSGIERKILRSITKGMIATHRMKAKARSIFPAYARTCQKIGPAERRKLVYLAQAMLEAFRLPVYNPPHRQ